MEISRRGRPHRLHDEASLPTYHDFQLGMSKLFQDERLLCGLSRGLGANILVVGQDWLAGSKSQMEDPAAFIRPLYSDGDVVIYGLQAPDGACRSGRR